MKAVFWMAIFLTLVIPCQDIRAATGPYVAQEVVKPAAPVMTVMGKLS